MYVGVRAGGGIGDEIEDPAGDEYELYRVVFDITFFFFVIVILLAIIQGMASWWLKKIRLTPALRNSNFVQKQSDPQRSKTSCLSLSVCQV